VDSVSPANLRLVFLNILKNAHVFYHPGFNPISISKAFVANILAGKTVRGGSYPYAKTS